MSDRVRLKHDAKAVMREKARPVFLTTILFLVISTVVDLLIQSVLGMDRWANEVIDINMSFQQSLLNPAPTLLGDINGAYMGAMRGFVERLTPFDGVLGLVLSLAMSIVSFGYVIACLRISRRQDTDVRTLFDGFAHAVKLIGLQIVIGVFVFLWTLLLVVPGIIAAFRYSMALWILADDPSKGILQCIGESKEMMRGHKFGLFVLGLSFIGWALVGSIISMFLSAFIGAMVPLFSVWLLPYMQLTTAGFYNRVSGADRAADPPAL
ncbi:MAG: DUF975 family protein [Oscillospiraceae bacterium]|jgi:uncharacterized membrane protein|nr:DUF975 family protein [Oscillospiraceae bacterium]